MATAEMKVRFHDSVTPEDMTDSVFDDLWSSTPEREQNILDYALAPNAPERPDETERYAPERVDPDAWLDDRGAEDREIFRDVMKGR